MKTIKLDDSKIEGYKVVLQRAYQLIKQAEFKNRQSGEPAVCSQNAKDANSLRELIDALGKAESASTSTSAKKKSSSTSASVMESADVTPLV